jgi:ribose 5-phosphate isomerase B
MGVVETNGRWWYHSGHMRVAIAADHAGYHLKQQLITALRSQSFEITDLGTDNPDTPDDYPDFAEALGNAISAGSSDRGILLCGSGVGASVAANKIKGIRAGLCHDTYSAHQGVEHDNINILVLGSRVIGPALATELAFAFLNAVFTHEERHERRLRKVMAIEERHR